MPKSSPVPGRRRRTQIGLKLDGTGADSDRVNTIAATTSRVPRPAVIAGLVPPRLAEGQTAEFVLIDPEARWKPEETKLRSKSKNTPFMSRELNGKILLTLARGSIAFDSLGGAA